MHISFIVASEYKSRYLKGFLLDKSDKRAAL